MAFVNQETLQAFIDKLRSEMQDEVVRIDAETGGTPWKAQVEAMLVDHDSRWQATTAGLETLYQQAKAEIDALKKV